MFNNLFNSFIFSTFTGADRVDLQTTRKGIPMAFPHLYNTSDNILNRNKMKKGEINSERWLSIKDFPYEEWRPVVGAESRYLVSNFGRVKSLPTKRRRWVKILHQANVNEYLSVLIYGDDGRRKMQFVHRLVATAFIPNPYNFPYINHRDEDKSNNKVINLEWCTPKYNTNYGYARERCSKAMTPYKRPVDKYTLDGEFVCTVPSISEAAPYQDDCTMRHIWDCCNGGRRSVRGFVYRYHGAPAPIIKKEVSYVVIELRKDDGSRMSFNGYKPFAEYFGLRLYKAQAMSQGTVPRCLKNYDITITRKTSKYEKVIFNSKERRIVCGT